MIMYSQQEVITEDINNFSWGEEWQSSYMVPAEQM